MNNFVRSFWMRRKYILKLMFFILIVCIFQFFLSGDDISREVSSNIHNVKNVDVVLFGSSVNKYYDGNDEDRRSISEIIDDEMPELSVYGISSGSYHPDLFYSYFYNILTKDLSGAQYYLFEINLRAFSAQWGLRPTSNFTEQKHLLQFYPVFGAFVRPFKQFGYRANNVEEIILKQYFESPVFKGERIVGHVKDFDYDGPMVTATSTKRRYVYHYLYKLEMDNNQIQMVKKIIEISKKYHKTILFYILPVDYQSGEKSLPGEFNMILDKNIETLKSIFAYANVPYLDLSKRLTPEYFAFEKYRNEHLKESGRVFVAKEIITWLESYK